MAKSDLDADLIRRLAALLEETGLVEIEVQTGDRRARVRRGEAGSAATPPAATTAPACAEAQASAKVDGHTHAVTSPMVGIVYLAPEPGAQPFVGAGEKVVAGQTLMIIEAMKVMNPISAPRGGTVTRVLVSDRQPVEYGEALLVLE